MHQRSKTILFVLFVIVLWLPLIQQQTKWFQEIELRGAFIPPSKPQFAIDSLKELKFQKQFENFQNWNFGFRGFMVKVRNSFNHIVFDELGVKDNVQGKDGFIFQTESLEQTLGIKYESKERYKNIVKKIRFIKDDVEKHGGHFLVVLAPSKEKIYPDYLPRPYFGIQRFPNEYNDFTEEYKKQGIPLIDFSPYFIKLRDTCKYPLFNKTSHHWSMFGASCAQDSLLSYIEKSLGRQIPKCKRVGLEVSDTARESDADFEGPLNLFYSLQQPQYVYPKYEMIVSTKKNYKPKVVFIGDSFFWQVRSQKMLQNIFSSDSQFWFYFSAMTYPVSDKTGNLFLKDADAIEDMQSADFVILFSNIATLDWFPFGLDDYYNENVSKPQITNFIEQRIASNPKQAAEVRLTAEAEKISFENALTSKARLIRGNRKLFTLKASNNKYFCADAGKRNALVANRDEAYAWETFSMIDLGNGEMAIYSHDKKFLSAELAGNNEITATRQQIGSWEIFKVVKEGKDFISFKADNGKFLSLDENSGKVFAIADAIGKNEKFKISYIR